MRCPQLGTEDIPLPNTSEPQDIAVQNRSHQRPHLDPAWLAAKSRHFPPYPDLCQRSPRGEKGHPGECANLVGNYAAPEMLAVKVYVCWYYRPAADVISDKSEECTMTPNYTEWVCKQLKRIELGGEKRTVSGAGLQYLSNKFSDCCCTISHDE